MTKADIKKYHKQFAYKDNCIGRINCWRFKGVYLFLNYDKRIVEIVSKPNVFSIVSRGEFDAIYEKKNIHEGSEREVRYGKMHEGVVKLMGEGTDDNGQHSNDFVRYLAYISANIAVHKKLTELKLPIEPTKCSEKQLVKYRKVVTKLHLGNSSVYSNMCDKGFAGEVSDKEYKKIAREFKKLPDFWKKNAFEGDEESKQMLA